MMWRFGNLVMGLGVVFFLLFSTECFAQQIIEIRFEANSEKLSSQNHLKLDTAVNLFKSLPTGTKIIYSASPGGGVGDSIENDKMMAVQWERVLNSINYLKQKGIKRSQIVFGTGCFMARDIHEIRFITPDEPSQPLPQFPAFKPNIDTLEFAENEISLDSLKMHILDKYYRLSHSLPENQIVAITDLVGVSCGDTKQNDYQWSRTENCIKYLQAKGIKYNKLVWQSGGLGLTGLKYVIEIRVKEIESSRDSPPFPNLKR